MNGQFLSLELWLALIAWSALTYILGAASSRFVARVIDTIRRHSGRVRRALARIIGIETRAARSAAATAKTRGLGYMTDLDDALRVMDIPSHAKATNEANDESSDDASDEAAGKGPALYDFSLEESLLKREKGYFRCIRVPPESGFIPDSLTKKMTDEVVDEYVNEADRFFNHYVPLQVSEKSLYDDAEAAVIVSFFRNSDRRCFYLLNEMRKTINGNIWRMVQLFSIIWLISVAVLVLGFSGQSVELFSSVKTAFADPNESLDIKAWSALLLLAKPLCGLIVLGIAAVLIATFQASGYKLQQEHSARELNWFLSRWLDRINDRYRDAKAEAKGATVGEEKDTNKVSEAAKRWHKIMMWMAFRLFFIESFYRNIRFQIDRNRSYYDMGPNVVLLFGAIGLPITYWLFPALLPGDFVMGGLLFVLLIFISAFYWRRYHRKVVPIELEENWIGFDNLELGKAMDDVVGKYGEEVGYWKNRTGRIE